MKILYLRTLYWFGLKAGGSVGHTAGIINAMDKKVELSVVSNDFLPDVDKDITIVRPIKIPLVPKDILELFYNFKIIKYCKNLKPGAIYQRYNGFSFCGAYIAKMKNIPFVLEFNSSDVWKIKNWKNNDTLLKRIFKTIYYKIFKLPIVSTIEKYNLNSAAHIVVVSDALKNILLKFGVDENKIIINPNGIDERKYNPQIKCDDIKQKYNLENKIVIGFIGTFGQWHGAENIALAFGRLLKKYPEYKNKTKLFMIGDGVRMPIVKKHILEFNLQENVVLTGLIPQEQGAKFLSACDILINATVPNPDGSEFFGSPTKLFEYMAMGKAIICSNMAQMSEILEHGKTAYMVEPGNIDELATAMKELVDDGELRQRLGDSARDEVIQKYTWDKHVDKILKVISNE
ncbi:glycosyltransferase family 4 protein [uncultured Campylobacter sp.]|uniref:glycosyltransferase family 4 protein n=1 Tax=uncultured Campylobacter sp. TaxID=218934 RepID=UPI00260B504A|nr:glycosyltransferase family 4 protein [uncultured Campylobacter sp.]